MTDFSQLNLDPRIEKALEEMDFHQPTDIQAEVIPLIRSGADVIAKSQTGTGKTAAFGIPVLESIDTEQAKATIQALILCPTRELAQQTGAELGKLARFLPGIRMVEVFGGASMEQQFIQLRKAHIVVGTPGRVMDHMRRGTIKLQNLRMIVLDEADEMLRMGFKEDIESILSDTAESRQTILFSATMPPAILAIGKTFQKDPQIVEINKSQVTLTQIDQSCVEVPLTKKMEALDLLLRYHSPNRALVFCNTKHKVDEVCEYLNTHGFSAESIHGDLKQAQRTRVMNEFKRGRVAVLIATDVAARGIDVNDLDFVFNFDIPMNTEYYVHRIGRTGRAGKLGNSITIFSGKRQMSALRTLSRTVKVEIRQDKLPTQAEIRAKALDRNVEAVAQAVENGAWEAYQDMAARLMAKDYPQEQLLAALLSLHFPAETLPAEITVPSGRSMADGESRRSPAKRTSSAFADVMVNIGSANGVEPKHLVGAITERSGISGSQVGKIDIYPDYSVVGVPEDRIGDVLESMHNCKICGKPTITTPLITKGRTSGAPRKPSKAGKLSDRLVSQSKQARKAAPVRRKRKIPDFEG